MTTPTTTTLVAVPSTVDPGDPFVLTATLSTTLGTGTYAFYKGATLIGTVPLVAGVASLSFSIATPGVAAMSAVYSGDSNYSPSTGNANVTVTNFLGIISTFDADPANPLPYRWHSKQFYVAYPTVFRFARVSASSYANLTLNLFADGVQYASIPVTRQTEFALPQPQSATPSWPSSPSALCFKFFEFELAGTDTVNRAQFVEDIEEFT